MNSNILLIIFIILSLILITDYLILNIIYTVLIP